MVKRILRDSGTSRSGLETFFAAFCLEILIGSCDITTTHHGDMKKFTNLGNRKNVFDSKPDSILIGPQTDFDITCTSESADILMPKVVLHDESLLEVTLIFLMASIVFCGLQP